MLPRLPGGSGDLQPRCLSAARRGLDGSPALPCQPQLDPLGDPGRVSDWTGSSARHPRLLRLALAVTLQASGAHDPDHDAPPLQRSLLGPAVSSSQLPVAPSTAGSRPSRSPASTVSSVWRSAVAVSSSEPQLAMSASPSRTSTVSAPARALIESVPPRPRSSCQRVAGQRVGERRADHVLDIDEAVFAGAPVAVPAVRSAMTPAAPREGDPWCRRRRRASRRLRGRRACRRRPRAAR